LDIDQNIIPVALSTFEKYKVTDQIKLVEGPAADTLMTLKGEFDIIFIDADKTGYKAYIQIILDQDLLSKNGIIITDNSLFPQRVRMLTKSFSEALLSIRLRPTNTANNGALKTHRL
jgi:predicted O-methyltransferase YrrM